MKRNILIMFLLACVAAISSCKKWDDHTALNEAALGRTLLEEIKSNPDLSKFYEYVVKTGYDTILASSKTFTVWAPSNAALAELDASVTNDPEQLRLLIGNHISNQSYFTTSVPADTVLRVRALNGKNVIFSKESYDEAGIVSKDRYVANGVLHVVDKAILPKMSIWEYLNASTDGTIQKEQLAKLTSVTRDLTRSKVIAYDSNGDPIYQEGVGLVTINKYLQKVDISNEDSLYTYIILTDDAFLQEKDKLKQYFLTDTAEVTDSLASFSVIKDLAIRGRYTKDNLPATLYSAKDSVVYHLDKNAIVKSYVASNGIVHVMNRIDYELQTKLKPVTIEGEWNYTLNPNKTVQIRTRRNSMDPNDPKYNSFFRDLLIQNHGISSYAVKYTPMLNSVTYKVYLRAVRDFDLEPATGATDLNYFRMKIAFGTPSATDLPYVEKVGVVDNGDGTFSPNYEEVYVGDYTPGQYGKTDVFVVGNNVTTNGLNTILVDYVKLVPAP